jgi:hypothetical protein
MDCCNIDFSSSGVGSVVLLLMLRIDANQATVSNSNRASIDWFARYVFDRISATQHDDDDNSSSSNMIEKQLIVTEFPIVADWLYAIVPISKVSM